MKRKELTMLDNDELFNQFKWVASKCVIQPFEALEFKKNDKDNIDRIVHYKNNIEDYITIIKELKSRGYALQEIMEIG
jgi:hypothetical protein